MRLESLEPASESQFYACLRRLTGTEFFYERIEPSDESGVPDLYFTYRHSVAYPSEGMIELKYAETQVPNIRSLMRGTQKAALLDYNAAGGVRRFALAYCQGVVYFWKTSDLAKALLSDGRGWTSSCELASPEFRDWIRSNLLI